MVRLLVPLLTLMLALVAPAAAQERPGESQRRAPSGMTSSDGIGELVAEIYGATPPEGGWPPMRYFSRRMQSRIVADQIRPVPRVAPDWLRRADYPWPSPRFHAWVLNTSGALGDRPASAVVSLGFDDGTGWGRRMRLIDEGGYWVIDHVCMFPEVLSLDAVLDRPGPTESGHDPLPVERRFC